MASNNAYKRLARMYDTMGTDMYYRPLVVNDILKELFTLKMPELLSSTALELAFKKKDIKIFKFLLQRGTDFTRKNKQGSTVLHQTIDSSTYNDDSTYWMIETSESENLFAEAVLDAHVKVQNSSNPCNEHGLSHFHVACMMNHAKAVECFLKAGASPNQTISNDSTVFPGFTPLHLAVKFGAIETLQLLLQTNVKIDAKNAKGMSPLELLIKDKMDIWIKLTEAIRFGWAPNATHFRNYFDLNKRITVMILLKFDPQTQVVDEATGLSRFHIACTTIKPETLWPGYTPLHFAAHYKFQVFEVLLDAGADLQAVDSKGQTPFDICLRNFELRDIEAILRRKDEWANIRFSDGRNRLLDFIVALQKIEGFDAFLKENFVDVNSRIPEDSPLCRGYTPLHLAVACCVRLLERRVDDSAGILSVRYIFCLDVCLRLGCDVTAKNCHGSTPVHVAFHLGCADLIRMLLDQQMSADNPRDNAGVSHLHLASLTDSTSFVKKLPHGCDVLDAPLEIGDFVWKGSSCVRNGATPLSIALSVEAFVTAEALIERGARIPVDEFGRFAKMDEAELLLRQYPLDSEEVLRQCGWTLQLVVDKMTNNSQFRNYLVERHELTRLHVAVLIGADIDELIDDVNARVPLDSPLWPGCTALHLLNYRRQFWKVTSVVRSLLGRRASVTMKNAYEATPIHEAFDRFPFNDDTLSLLDTLLCQSDANAVDLRGISHFHIAAAVGRVDVVEGFLRNGVNVDEKIDDFSDKYRGYTALHLAVAFGRDEVVNTLLAHGAKVHCESVAGNQPMHLAASNGSVAKIESIMKSLMRADADINAENLFGETPLQKLLKSNGATVEKVELFVKYGCQVKVFNSLSHEGSLAMALNLKDKSIYQSLINGYDHELDDFGRSAMHNIVSLKRPSWDLLESNTIEELFIPIKDYVKAILELSGTGLDIDFQDMLEMTPLHLAAMYQNVTGIIALLKCGADINLNEMKGLPPIIASMSHAHKATPVTHLDAQILEKFWMHIWKLRFFELHVSKFNLVAESKIQGRILFKDDAMQSCDAEIQAMDKEKIGSIALRGFLCETGVVAAYPTMLYDLRSSIDEYFKTNTNRLIEEFPDLSCLLLLQYRKARKRVDMAESCSAALLLLLNFEIPRLCSDRVFRFLTYDELKNLLASANFE